MREAPRIYRPKSALAEYTEIIGHWHAQVGYRSRALPRGAVTLIIDVGRRQQLDFYADDGRTTLNVPPAFLTGSHTGSYVSEMAADEPTLAVHFRPGGAYPFLGIPLSDLENAHVGLDQVWGRAGIEVHERLIDAPTMAARFSILESGRIISVRLGVAVRRGRHGVAGSTVLAEHDRVHAKTGRAMGFRQRYAGSPRHGQGLDRECHRHGRTRQRMETLGTPADSGRCAQRATRLLHRGVKGVRPYSPPPLPFFCPGSSDSSSSRGQ
jgi:hypothetical protein